MPLDRPIAPRAFMTAVVDSGRLTTAGAGVSLPAAAGDFGGAFEPPSVDIVAEHPVFAIEPRQVVAGESAGSAKAVGWRYLVNKDGDVITADVRLNPSGEHRVAEIATTSAVAEATMKAVEQAEEDPRVVAGNYELRLLGVRGLDLSTVWLKDKSGTDDYFIPIAPTLRVLTAGRSYSWDQLRDQIQGQIKARLDSKETA